WRFSRRGQKAGSMPRPPRAPRRAFAGPARVFARSALPRCPAILSGSATPMRPAGHAGGAAGPPPGLVSRLLLARGLMNSLLDVTDRLKAALALHRAGRLDEADAIY